MKKLVWLGLWFCSFQSFASDKASPFGQVTRAELESTYYELDSTAEAAILRDKGDVRIIYEDGRGFRAHYTREVKIKIYRKSGFSWADVELPYYVKDKYKAEMIRDIEAYSYTLHQESIQKNGLEKKDIFTDEVSERWSLKKFAFPNVREGSIIEYKYTVVSPYIFQLRDWQFQYEIPVVWSEYSAKIPAFYEYKILYQGYVPLVKNEAELDKRELRIGQYTYNNAKYQWAAENIPAFADESFISNKEDYLARLTFQLAKENFPGRAVRDYMETWPKLTDDLLKLTDYGKFLKRKDGKEKVEELTVGLSSNLDKAKAIYKFLGRQIRWNGENSLYPKTSPKDLLADGTGNSTDLNILLNNWLTLAGIDATPVLLSTRGHGLIQMKYPVIDQFNYSVVFAKIDGKEYLLDITDPYQPFGIIPIYCLNGYGLLVDKKEEQWIALERGHIYHAESFLTTELQPESETLITTVNKIYRGYAALDVRQQLRNDPEGIPEYSVDDFRVIDQDNIEKDLRILYTQQQSAIQLGDYLYVETFPGSPFDENPFKATERKHPIDYSYRRTYRQTLNLKIPEGYIVEELPASVTLNLEGSLVQFIFQSQQNSVGIQVVSLIRINQSLISAEQYQELRRLYEEILVKHQEKIVLKKTKTE